MGTRSITHVHQMESMENGENVVCSFFRHWDGYPTGHGQDLANWLKGKKLTNGIGADFDPNTMFNRAGTMAIKLANHIQDLSGAEMIPTGGDDMWEDFTYDIYYRDDEFLIGINNKYPIPVRTFDGEKIEIDNEDE